MGSRSRPKVEHHVEDRSFHAEDQLGLERRSLLVMYTLKLSKSALAMPNLAWRSPGADQKLVSS